jgi:N-acetylglucosamine kinase-like BadF-type ATPase
VVPERRGRPAILAVDGGNSKTDAVLVARSGAVLGAARSRGSSNVGLGTSRSVDALGEAIMRACLEAGLSPNGRPLADTGVYCLAGADLPVDERRVARALAARGWTAASVVRNDTFGVLRAGTDRGWGVAVVCGAGMNCVGLAPNGRAVRFPALGDLSGDWAAGGEWLGLTALGVAVRARDGRGEPTVLERLVPEHFGLRRPAEVMEAMYVGRLDRDRLLELPPLLFAAAAQGDPVARGIIERLADEVVAMATAAIRRLRLASRDVEVILGGGVFRNEDGDFLERIQAGVRSTAHRAEVHKLDAPPVLGAGLIGLDRVGASARAAARLRTALTHGRMDGH